ncbi:hypothetical protein JXA85_02575 [Candidatus Woesearchaeota archaeon]|nr:hypothetical protein [Candidatus Woesearchaeota archaeon]
MKESQFFVKINEFKEIFDIVNTIKAKLDEAHKSFEKIYGLKAEEEKFLEQWKQDIDEVERKIGFVEGVLFTRE